MEFDNEKVFFKYNKIKNFEKLEGKANDKINK
jgi:hypothetical protein